MIEGRSLKPKPMTIAQINKFCQLNKYKSQEAIALAWLKKKSEHQAYWREIYKDKKIISYPKLKLAWRIKGDKAQIAYKQISWDNACKITLQTSALLNKIQNICHANYCQFEPGIDYSQQKGFIIFMSLPELIG